MRYLYVALFMLTGASLHAQSKVPLIPKIDPTSLRHRVWLDLSNGPSLTTGDFFLFGPGISVGWITKNHHSMKIKSALHVSPELFVNFPQQTGELSIMTGAIWPHTRNTLEFHYGVGLTGGVLHGKEKYEGSSGFFNLDFTSDYERVNFFTVGIPLEFKIQWRVFGLGADANLNTRMPYFGVKLFTRIGVVRNY